MHRGPFIVEAHMERSYPKGIISSRLIYCKKQFLHSDWLTTYEFPNSAEKWNTIVQTLLTPNFVNYGQKKWSAWHFGFLKTVTCKYFEVPDRASLRSHSKNIGVELSLVSSFWAMTSLAPSLCHPHQHFSTKFGVHLQFHIAPAKFLAFISGSKSKVEWKKPPQCALESFWVVATKFTGLR